MTLQHQLNNRVNQWNLLTNPFYVAWNAGTLSKHALQAYTSEYGAFIALLPLGWATLHDIATAHEEEEHDQLWQQFASSIQTKKRKTMLPQSKALVRTAKKLFATQATAMGAMYAFEVQQPKTAQSKKAGLQNHYAHLHADETYFDVHAHNEHESEKLLSRMNTLTIDEQHMAINACETMSKALWDALTAIYHHTMSS